MHTIVGMKNRLHVGKNVKLQNTIFNVWSGEIIIGDYSFFGHNSCVVTGTHDIRLTDIKRQKAVPESGRDIFIGTSVWISTNVTIIGPCTIGDNSVIAAGSVLLPGKYPANSLFAGNPAVFKKKIDLTE